MKSLKDVDYIFQQESQKDHSGYYLQTMLYSSIVAHQYPDTPVSPALLFIQHAGVKDYDPILKFDKVPINDVKPYIERFNELLCQTISQMYDPSVPLVPTDDSDRCAFCPYKALCH